MAEQKKGLIYRLTMGKDNLPDFMPDKLPGSRWALFKDVFFNRIGAMAKISILTLMFFIPLIVVLVIFYMLKQSILTYIPYPGNIGIGHPVVRGMEAYGQMQMFYQNLYMFLFCIPCVIIAGIGLAGAFHVMKLLAWEEGDSVANNFFIGIKKNIKQYLCISLFAALMIFMFSMTLSVYNNISETSTAMEVMRVIGLVFSILFFILFLCMLIFVTTQAVTYDLKLRHLIKNSFIFALALLPQNLFFLAISLLPVLLIFFLPIQIGMFVILLYAIIGFSFTILIWTVYAHWAYDKFVNDRVEGAVKHRGMHIKTVEEAREAEIEALKTRNVLYGSAYLSKRLSSIDEGSDITPLSETFSRADLARLKTERDHMEQETEAEIEEIQSEIEAKLRAYEEEEAQKKKKRKKPGSKPGKVQDAPQADASATTDLPDLPDLPDLSDLPALDEPKPKPQQNKPHTSGGQNRAKIVANHKKKGGKH